MRVAGLLDSKFRRMFHNPNKILKPYIKKNMTVLDVGCGPGVFSIEMANLMEGTGRVISIDMQKDMLEIIRSKIQGTAVEKSIVLHQCSQNALNIKEKADFVLMFYMVHEVPNKENLFNEILPLVNKDGLIMIVEPGLLSKREFTAAVNLVLKNGFTVHSNLKIPLSKGIVLRKT